MGAYLDALAQVWSVIFSVLPEILLAVAGVTSAFMTFALGVVVPAWLALGGSDVSRGDVTVLTLLGPVLLLFGVFPAGVMLGVW